MNKNIIILSSAIAALSMVACQEKETTVREEVSDKVGDALNTRDHEKLRDAGEDLEKDVQKVAEDLEQDAQKVAEDIEKEAKKVGEGIGEALKEVGDEIKKEAEKAAN